MSFVFKPYCYNSPRKLIHTPRTLKFWKLLQSFREATKKTDRNHFSTEIKESRSFILRPSFSENALYLIFAQKSLLNFSIIFYLYRLRIFKTIKFWLLVWQPIPQSISLFAHFAISIRRNQVTPSELCLEILVMSSNSKGNFQPFMNFLPLHNKNLLSPVPIRYSLLPRKTSLAAFWDDGISVNTFFNAL